MKKIITALLLTCLSTAAFAEVKNTKNLPGHYYLQGIREVGSELLLSKDGQFQWMTSYGGFDQFAQGSWHLEKDKVILVSSPQAENPAFRLFSDEEMRINKPAEAGTWVAITGVPGLGPIPGIEVRFESKSGKISDAITDKNGDAIIEMPESEEWARAALRKGKSAWQWFDIPAERRQERLAAFACLDRNQARPVPFEKLPLQIEEDGLRIVDDSVPARLIYVKQ
ncbi:hypothetical protein [Iodobacter fluviatilis]|uniref:Nickel uptake substrate-specific transmembrane region n=1 Tax=Iodobacter fluviatilis TaxID=537 RepID=A0A377Q6D4_9NEIS|nr:hypothetical protein [Iodobacter fluviatilis]TCU86987.1 hypothetical protein EV682_105112 [Iodobacter fluviatilis]STQ90318.1 Uncharacterised protein [Iodobacter fluviatilis]